MSVARSTMAPSTIGPAYALTFWPNNVISPTPWAASDFTSAITESNGRDTSSPRVYGTTQNVQYLLQPSMTETNADDPSARGAGRLSNFSISGNDTSTTARPVRFSWPIMSGRRCSVWGPNTRST